MGQTGIPQASMGATPTGTSDSPPHAQPTHDFTLQAVMGLEKSHGELREAIISIRLNGSQSENRIEKSFDKLQAQIEKSLEKFEAANIGAINKLEVTMERKLTALKVDQDSLAEKVASHSKYVFAIVACTAVLTAIGGTFGFFAYKGLKQQITEDIQSSLQENTSKQKKG